MLKPFLEVQRLKATLIAKGFDEPTAQAISEKAEREINNAMETALNDAMDKGIAAGVEKDSADFINELIIRPTPGAFELNTDSGNTDFSTPPFPNLGNLLKNAKPIKDGSGVYKVIPVGGASKKPPIASNIFDAQKAISAQRAEEARKQYQKVIPERSKGGQVQFRTATSKQSANDHWVIPAKNKNFADDLRAINTGLEDSLRDIVESIIKDYEDNF